VDQFYLVSALFGGAGYFAKTMNQNYHLVKAAEAKDLDVKGKHRFRGNLTDAQIADAYRYSRILKWKAVILGVAPVVAAIAYINAKKVRPKI
jgi:hypothetical protein